MPKHLQINHNTDVPDPENPPSQRAGFDGVRAAAMAVAQVDAEGLESWVGTSLSTALLSDVARLEAAVGRGLSEVGALLKSYGVR